MALKVTQLLKDNGIDAKGTGNQPPSETAEEKAAREKREKEASGGGGETAEEKSAREKREKEAAGGGGETADEKAAREKKEKEAAGGGGETAEEKAAREKKEKEAAGGGNQPVIDDAAVLEYLKKSGKNINSLDDIGKPASAELTDEEKREQAEQRRDAVRKFALTNKKATSTDFDNYVRETSIPKKELAFRLYKEERLTALKKANTPADQIPDDKALQEEFNEAHFQYAAEDDAKRLRSERLLEQSVDNYIQDKYANILDLEEEYDSHEQTTVRKQDYGKLIDSVVDGLGTEMSFEIIIDKDKGTKFPFTFKITPEVQKAMKATYMNDTSFNLFGQGNVNKELLEQAIRGNIIQREYQNIISEGAVAYASSLMDEKAKGRRGIPPVRKEEGNEGGEKTVNKVVKGILENAENKKVLQTT